MTKPLFNRNLVEKFVVKVLCPFVEYYIVNIACLQVCQGISDVEIECVTPSMYMALKPVFRTADSVLLNYGLRMDNTRELLNLTKYQPYEPGVTEKQSFIGQGLFQIFEDPSFDAFENGKKYFQLTNEYLTINVRNSLNLLFMRGLNLFM